MATKAHLEANKRYLDRLDNVIFRVPKGKRDEIRAMALQRGYSGIQPYIIALLEKDGVEIKEKSGPGE